MKVGDLVRRGKTYKPAWRKETALVTDTRAEHPYAKGIGPVVKLLWSNGDYDPIYMTRTSPCPDTWYPCELLEVVQQ